MSLQGILGWPLGDESFGASLMDWLLGCVLMPVSVRETGLILRSSPVLEGPAMNFAALLQHYFLHSFKEEKIAQDPAFIPM